MHSCQETSSSFKSPLLESAAIELSLMRCVLKKLLRFSHMSIDEVFIVNSLFIDLNGIQFTKLLT